MLRWLALLCVTAAPGLAPALTLELPATASVLADQASAADSYQLPLAPFDGQTIPARTLEGAITRQTWQVGAQGLTSLQIFAPLRQQLEQEGYTILFECAGEECGGFDFRFGTEVLPAPDMHVDLTDFRFLSARKGDTDHLSLLVSRTANAGFVQLIRISSSAGGTTATTPTTIATPPQVPATQTITAATAQTPLAQELIARGHVVLSDLTFETGSSDLGAGPFASLQALAAFLLGQPDRRVALVGHTDTVGPLDRNVALSKRRAASVLERLVSAHGVPRSQLEAEGMGYLSPVAPNQTDTGREANRRVEVVLLNTR